MEKNVHLSTAKLEAAVLQVTGESISTHSLSTLARELCTIKTVGFTRIFTNKNPIDEKLPNPGIIMFVRDPSYVDRFAWFLNHNLENVKKHGIVDATRIAAIHTFINSQRGPEQIIGDHESTWHHHNGDRLMLFVLPTDWHCNAGALEKLFQPTFAHHLPEFWERLHRPAYLVDPEHLR